MARSTTGISGAEAWAVRAGDIGVLVLHGFTGNPVSMRPLAESMAAEGFSVEMPLLPGHGTTWQDMQRTTWRDWAREVVAALERLRADTRAVVAAGLSMGGTMALHLAETRGEDLAGLSLVNPSVRITDPRLKALPALKHVLRSLPAIGNDIAKEGGDERAYPRTPLKPLASLVELQGRVRADLRKVTVPTIVFTSRADHVVDPVNSRIILDGISSTDTEQVWLERSYHVATLDHDADEIFRRTGAFVRRVTAQPASPAAASGAGGPGEA